MHNLTFFYRCIYSFSYSIGIVSSYYVIGKILDTKCMLLRCEYSFIFMILQIIFITGTIALEDIFLSGVFDNETNFFSNKRIDFFYFRETSISVTTLVVYYRTLSLFFKYLKNNESEFTLSLTKEDSLSTDVVKEDILKTCIDKEDTLPLITKDSLNTGVAREEAIPLAKEDTLNISMHKEDTLSLRKEVTIIGLNKDEKVHLMIDDFLYAKSEGHYVKLFYFSKITNHHTKFVRSIIIRSSMKSLETTVFSSFENVHRVQRGYFVNINYVKFLRNIPYSQGGFVTLSTLDIKIPVGKSHLSKINSYIELKKPEIPIY